MSNICFNQGGCWLIYTFFAKWVSVSVSVNRGAFRSTAASTGRYFSKIGVNVEKVPALGHQQRGISRSVLCLLLNLSGGFFSPPSYCSKGSTVSHHISVCQHLFALWFKCVQWEGDRAVPFTAGDTFCCVCFSDGQKWSINIFSIGEMQQHFSMSKRLSPPPPSPCHPALNLPLWLSFEGKKRAFYYNNLSILSLSLGSIWGESRQVQPSHFGGFWPFCAAQLV